MSSTSSAAVLKPSKTAVLKAEGRSSSGSVASCKEAVTLSLFYHGPSMNPVLKTPDILHLVPYGEKQIRRGDVVVFIPPGGDTKIVHRVLSVGAQGVRTKGDNTPGPDSWMLDQNNIIGRLVCIERRGRRLRICGGTLGRAQSSAAKSIRLVGAGIRQLFMPIYRGIAGSGALKRWASARMRTKVISFARDGGTELQLVIGSRVIGRRPAGRRYWLIKRPFMLFVDEKSLPSGD